LNADVKSPVGALVAERGFPESSHGFGDLVRHSERFRLVEVSRPDFVPVTTTSDVATNTVAAPRAVRPQRILDEIVTVLLRE
jgi:hypothetical protein